MAWTKVKGWPPKGWWKHKLLAEWHWHYGKQYLYAWHVKQMRYLYGIKLNGA